MTRPTPQRDRPTKLRTNVAMLLVTACLAPLVTGCATGDGTRRTVRLIDGKPEATRYVSPNAYQHYLEARLLIGRHDITGAIKHLRTALLFDEHSPLLYTELARLYQGRAAHKKARATLDKALAIQSDFPDALLIAGELAEKEHPAEAIRAYRRCVTTDPAFPPCAQRLAKLYEGQDRSKEARAIWLNLVKHRPQDARAHAHFGDFCLRHLDLACAATHYAQALTRRAPLGLLLRIAQTERALGHFPQAAKILHEVFDRSDGSLDVAKTLLDVLLQSSAHQKIRDLLTVLRAHALHKPQDRARVARLFLRAQEPRDTLTLIDAAPLGKPSLSPSIDVIVARGLALDRLGRHDAARAALTPGLKDPKSPLAALTLARLETRQGHLRRALAILEAATKHHADHAGLVGALSAATFAAGQKERALSVLRHALTTHGSNRQLHFIYAAALARAGKTRRAITEVDGLLAKRRNVATYHNFVGYLLADRRIDLDRAARHLRLALRLDPGRAYIIDSWGWLSFRRGENAAARHIVEIAHRLAPQDGEIAAHLAEINAALGHVKEALTLYTQAIAHDERPWKVADWRSQRAKLLARPVGGRP